MKNQPKTKIIYIDDEVEACKTIAEFFSLRGFDVHITFDGDSGYSMIKKEQPHLVILDLKIAGTSGIDLLQKLVDERVQVPVIVVTAYQEAMAEIRERGLMVNKYLTKPYNLTSLYDAVLELTPRRGD
ncbi:response regulator [Candidatus Omnitrophota bacterium]